MNKKTNDENTIHQNMSEIDKPKPGEISRRACFFSLLRTALFLFSAFLVWLVAWDNFENTPLSFLRKEDLWVIFALPCAYGIARFVELLGFLSPNFFVSKLTDNERERLAGFKRVFRSIALLEIAVPIVFGFSHFDVPLPQRFFISAPVIICVFFLFDGLCLMLFGKSLWNFLGEKAAERINKKQETFLELHSDWRVYSPEELDSEALKGLSRRGLPGKLLRAALTTIVISFAAAFINEDATFVFLFLFPPVLLAFPLISTKDDVAVRRAQIRMYKRGRLNESTDAKECYAQKETIIEQNRNSVFAAEEAEKEEAKVPKNNHGEKPDDSFYYDDDKPIGLYVLGVFGLCAYCIAMMAFTAFATIGIENGFLATLAASILIIPPALYAIYLIANKIIGLFRSKKESPIRSEGKKRFFRSCAFIHVAFACTLLIPESISDSGTAPVLLAWIPVTLGAFFALDGLCLFIFRKSLLRFVSEKFGGAINKKDQAYLELHPSFRVFEPKDLEYDALKAQIRKSRLSLAILSLIFSSFVTFLWLVIALCTGFPFFLSLPFVFVFVFLIFLLNPILPPNSPTAIRRVQIRMHKKGKFSKSTDARAYYEKKRDASKQGTYRKKQKKEQAHRDHLQALYDSKLERDPNLPIVPFNKLSKIKKDVLEEQVYKRRRNVILAFSAALAIAGLILLILWLILRTTELQIAFIVCFFAAFILTVHGLVLFCLFISVSDRAIMKQQIRMAKKRMRK